jgi:hypothetical protein
MPHTLKYNPDMQMIEANVFGEVSLNEVGDTIAELVVMLKENDCSLMLNNYLEASIKLSTTEIYRLPSIIAEIFVSSGVNVHRLKRAFVVKNDLEDFKFFEVVALNRGQNIRIFHNIDEARNWLLEK